MKKLFTLTAALLCSVMLFAQGVNFQNLTYAEALEKAKAENKLVFVDCYTSWCGPCKMMTNEVFPQKEAGDYFNPLFVCVKFDMEKGEGVELAKKFGIRAFPTFLIVRPDGTIQHRVVGGGDLEGFIERVAKGLDEKTSLLYLDEKYESGKMKKKELPAYYEALQDAYEQEKAQKVYDELLAQLTEKDKLKADYWAVMSSSKMGSDDFNLILANLPKFEKNIGKEKLDEFLYQSYSSALSRYMYGRKTEGLPALADLKTQIDALNIEQKQELLDLYELADIAVAKDTKRFVDLFEQKAEAGNMDEFTPLLSVAWQLGENLTKEDYSRMVVALEKLQGKMEENDNMKSYVEMMAYSFQKKAHVGTMFEELTFEQALEKAKKMRSMLFIDCYTSWCGPCKMMTSKVFPQEKVGDFMNQFICVKYDMEKGEGPELAEKFGVRAYPTFVILNWDGTLRHKLVGGGDADGFIERVKEAFDDNKALGALQAKYDGGNREKEFLAQYTQALLGVYDLNAAKVAEELFNVLTDEEKVSEDYWFLFSNPDLAPEGSAIAAYLLANRDKFIASLGKEKVDGYLFEYYYGKLMTIVMGRDEKATAAGVDQMKKDIQALDLQDGKDLIAVANIAKAALAGDQGKLLSTCEREVKNMKGEKFPFMIVYSVKEKATAAQLKRWEKVLLAAQKKMEDQNMAKRMDYFVNMLKN